ncbi:TetR family transcriptional regulator [Mucilaginibacter oryzae]|uniref:TetR family transcriptional regulator n=1 Tax=Mucilaginibacter oryzae TaxID=468058 RepID=A0A316HDQ8_9SPHI|nr:TetR/AcrR family transcriptional regulator [Mucilaginibacter oryzae]PWK79359.1 TetR family transcriptional regulator [Mucilaginibacter oryzae]
MKRTENDQVREEIILAAEVVFERYGYIRVSMQDISDECKKGRSTIYHYFKNKEEVLDALCEKLFLNCLAESEATISKRRSFSANIESFNITKLKNLRHFAAKYKLAIDDLRLDLAGFILKMRAFAEREVALVRQIIEWGVENKDISQFTTEEIDFLSVTLNSAFKSFEQEVIVFGKFPQTDSQVAWLAQMIHKGLS